MAYKPKKIIEYSILSDFNRLLVRSIVLLIAFSFILYGILITSNITYSPEKQVVIILKFSLLSLIFIPSFFVSISGLKFRLSDKLKIAIFLSINCTVFYLSIPIICFLFFLITENYFFYYFFFLLYFIVLIIMLIIFPVVINKKWNKFILTAISLLIFFLINLTYSQITNKKEIDPIFFEIESNDIVEKTRFDFLLETGDLMLINYHNYLDKRDPYYLQQILNEEKSITLIKNDLESIKNQIVFKSSKNLVITSLNAATALQQLIGQTERIIEIDQNYKNSLEKANTTLDKAKLLIIKNKDLISKNYNEVLTIQNRIQNYPFAVTLTEAMEMQKKLRAIQRSCSTSTIDVQLIDEMLLIIDQEQEKVDKYTVYLTKLVQVTDEISYIMKNYNENAKKRINAMEKIVLIYKLKNIFLF